MHNSLFPTPGLLEASSFPISATTRGLRPRYRGRGSRPASAASRSRNGGRPDRPANRLGCAQRGDERRGRLVRDQIGEAAATTVEQRRDLDQPVVTAQPNAPARSTTANPPARSTNRARTGFIAT